MKKFNIDNYDLFIFDFDGTIMDTEKYHYESYLKIYKEYDENINLDINNYFRLIHNIDKQEYNKFLKSININNHEEIYDKKVENFKDLIHKNKIDLIGNFDKFIQKLKDKNKEIIIVTNSSKKTIDYFRNLYPILNLFDQIYTKDDFTKKKPDPECYLKIQEIYKTKRMIGFEDSYQGFHALSYAKNIKPIHIKTNNYYYSNYIKNNYNVDIIDNYDCFN